MTAIVIITFNIHPDVFILQMEAIKRFCRDENFAIEVFDNSDNAEAAESVKYHSANQSLSGNDQSGSQLQTPNPQLSTINYTRVRAGTGDASWSHSFAANFAWALLQDKYDRFAFFDHDLLPVKDFSVAEILGGKPLAGLAQDKEHKYFWPGCFMFDNLRITNKELINFSPCPGLDTGGELYKAIDHFGLDQCVFFDEAYHQNPHFPNGQYNYYTMLYKETFMHFVNASNWNPVEGQQERLNSLINIARELINKNSAA